ncbi:unnamed protein product [Pylaiella littoralis]
MEVDPPLPSRGCQQQPSWTAADPPKSDFDKTDFCTCKSDEDQFATSSILSRIASATPGEGSTESASPCSADDNDDDGDNGDDTVSEDILMDIGSRSGGARALPGNSTPAAPPPAAKFPSTLTASPPAAVSSPSTPPLEVDSDSALLLETPLPPLARDGTARLFGADWDDSSTSSDDCFSLLPGRRRRRSGEGIKRARIGRTNDVGSPSAAAPAPFLSDRSRVFPHPPRRRREKEQDPAEGGAKKGNAGNDAASIARNVATGSAASLRVSPQQARSNSTGRREAKRKREFGLSPPDSSSSSLIVLADSPSSQRSRLTIPPPRRHDTIPESSESSRGKGPRREKPASSRIVDYTEESACAPWWSRATLSSSSTSSAPLRAASAAGASLSHSSSVDVLDLSIMSPPPREVIDILDDCTHSGEPSQLLSPASGVERGDNGLSNDRRERSGASGGGRSSSSSSSTVSMRPSLSHLHSTARGRKKESDARTSRARATSSSAGAAGTGTAVVELDDEGVEEDSMVEGRRKRRRRGLAGAAGAAATAGVAATAAAGAGPSSAAAMTRPRQKRQRRANSREDHLAARRLQRAESQEQERRDAALARRLQSEEQRSVSAAAAAVAGWDGDDGAGDVLEGAGEFASLMGGGAGGHDGPADLGWPHGASMSVSHSSGGVRREAGVAPEGGNRRPGGRSGARGSPPSSGRGGRGAHRRGGGSAAARQRRQYSRLLSGVSSASGASVNEWTAVMEYMSQQSSNIIAGMMGVPQAGGGGAEATHPSGSLAALQGRDLTSEDYQQLLTLDDRGGGTAAKKGLSQSEVEMLPMQIGNGSGPVDQCCICMEDMTSTEPIIRLPACLHTFHSKCIAKWVKEKPCCPIDKTAVSVSDSG